MRTCIGCGRRPADVGALCGPCREEMDRAAEENRKRMAALQAEPCDCKEPCKDCACTPPGE